MAAADLDHLIKLLARLPGFGPRSARRAALFLIKHPDAVGEPLARAIGRAVENVKPCVTCGNLDTDDPCAICSSVKRDRGLICVVEGVADLWALERSATFGGLYHVLGGTLSALDGVGPDDLSIAKLVERAGNELVREVILATNATVDGQTTAHYIADRLAGSGVEISGLAHGVPMGGELDFLDDGTLQAALKARKPL